MGRAVVHFEIVGKDGPGLNKFFGELFGWKIDADNPMAYGMVDRTDNLNSDGVGIGGGIMGWTEGMPEGPGHVTFYVEVPDVEASLAQAEALGGTRLHGPDDVPGGPTIGLFTDPEGHPIGVIQAAG
jgi:predicted enzyme related to lactoylglutathione lyase